MRRSANPDDAVENSLGDDVRYRGGGEGESIGGRNGWSRPGGRGRLPPAF